MLFSILTLNGGYGVYGYRLVRTIASPGYHFEIRLEGAGWLTIADSERSKDALLPLLKKFHDFHKRTSRWNILDLSEETLSFQ